LTLSLQRLPGRYLPLSDEALTTLLADSAGIENRIEELLDGETHLEKASK
jgi:hypothetical protein